MSRPVLLGVELVTVTDEDGRTRQVPDIGVKLRRHFRRTGPGIYTASWGAHALTVQRIGRIAGTLWFVGTGTRRAIAVLKAAGVQVLHAKDLTAAQRTAAIARGVHAIRRRSDGAVVGIRPPVVFAGQDPIAVGMDGAAVEGEEYE